MNAEQHYTREQLFENIIAALEKTGIPQKDITTRHLEMVDQFHVRGLEVSKELARAAGLGKDMEVLDIGCGIGGPCRMMAEEFECKVTGIDITREFIRTATLLTELTGLQDRVKFMTADALQLPFDDNSFDIVWTQHVQMNIADKLQFYSEIHRVLKPGGHFIYYDIFSVNDQPVYFPVPWADAASISHLFTIEKFREILNKAGLQLVEHKDQTTPAIAFMQSVKERIEQGLPAVSLQLIIGDRIKEKMSNVLQSLLENKIVLESGIGRKEH